MQPLGDCFGRQRIGVTLPFSRRRRGVRCRSWLIGVIFTLEVADIPKEILKCRSISREINFTSQELINSFRLEQRIYFSGTVIEGTILEFLTSSSEHRGLGFLLCRVVLRFRVCDSWFHKYLAVNNRCCRGKPDAARRFAEVCSSGDVGYSLVLSY